MEPPPVSLPPPTQMKPSRSLSIIVGNYDQRSYRQTNHLQNHNNNNNTTSTTTTNNNNNNHHINHNHSSQLQRLQNQGAAARAGDMLALPGLKNKFGHQLHSQYSMPCSLNQHRASQTSYQLSHSILDERIIYSQLSIVSKKDFAEEVRALLDVRKFVSDLLILLDITEVRIDAIIETIIDRLIECRQLGHSVAEEAKSQLTVDRDSLSMLLANTMQGIYKSRADGRLAHDHSWIVATCSLAGLQKRQVAITRFAHPINFGRQSQEVRFLIIVMAPNKEKLTKCAWETGRTFATMFTDIEFRRRLLRARNHEEIKVELLVRAESLARDLHHDDPEHPYSQDYDNNNRPEPFNHFDKSVARLGEFARAQGTSKSGGGGGGGAMKRTNRSKHKRGSGGSGGGGGPSSDKDEDGHDGDSSAPSSPSGLASGLLDDIKRRSKFYVSDFTDGLLGERTLYKTISTTIFLYFSVLLPCIAFGVVDTNNTDGHIDPKKTMIGQALGGLFFALFSGQPLVVVMTTAPLCIYIKVIFQISQDLEVDFGSFYACVGLWMALFLIIFSLTNASSLMRHCTRSTEDIFALFTAFAFGSDGVREAIRSFQKYYWESDCVAHHTQHVLVSRPLPETAVVVAAPAALAASPLAGLSSSNLSTKHHAYATHHALDHGLDPTTGGGGGGGLDGGHNGHSGAAGLGGGGGGVASQLGEAAFAVASQTSRCQRETCILFLFLMFGTLWLANSFNSFNRTPYLSSRKREIIKDYALAIAVLIFSFIGSYLFADIKLDVFEFGDFAGLHMATQMSQMSAISMATAGLLGFMASVLFYIDQNICGAMVNNAPYKLKKGNYFHLDLLVLAILNVFLSLSGLPWMHGKLPHSHLHSKALADYEERVDEGHIHQMIVNIRETRITGVLVSLLVGLSLLAVPYPLSYIPLPVLSGVFLYTALAEFKSNSMVERVCLLFTEQVAYPPNHYIRRCPQRKIHLFTFTQLLQLSVVSFIGFYPNPYVSMAFPLMVATFVPVRGFLLPRLIDQKYLNTLDRTSLE